MSCWRGDQLEIAVMGAGAVGCYYGFKLARAGHDVVLIGRPQHVEAIERQGLSARTQTFDEPHSLLRQHRRERGAARAARALLREVTTTESAAAAIKPHLAPDAVVLSMAKTASRSDRTARAAATGSDRSRGICRTEMAGPGLSGIMAVGNWSSSGRRPATTLVRADRSRRATEISDNVRGALWRKLITNCAYNALSRLPNCHYGGREGEGRDRCPARPRR